MTAFLTSPFSVPVLIVLIVVGLPIISSTVVKLSKQRQADNEVFEKTEKAFMAEIDSLKTRVANLETIVLNLEKHI